MARPSNSGGSTGSHWENAPGGTSEPPRRNFLVEGSAILIGGVIGLYPVAVGSLMFLHPVIKKLFGGGEKKTEGKPYLRVAIKDALPADGTPVQVPVLADLTDAWNRESGQPIGAVYLMRKGDDVTCFNAICPHAGCFVGYSKENNIFQCPCHTSSFQLDGKRNMPSPSPRDMDPLKVDEEKLKNGEVWVQFVNYYPGHEHRDEKK